MYILNVSIQALLINQDIRYLLLYEDIKDNSVSTIVGNTLVVWGTYPNLEHVLIF